MKKTCCFFFVLMLLLTLMIHPVFAAGKLSVVQEKFYVLPYLSYHAGYLFVEVKNIGDKPVEFNGGLLELYGTDGDSIESTNYMSCYPKFLDPGETGFMYLSKSVKEATDKSYIDDYLLTVTGKGAKELLVTRLTTDNPRLFTDESSYWKREYLIVDVSNQTSETQYGFEVVFALKDAEDNLLFADSVSPYNVGIKPGATVEVRVSMESKFSDFFEENGIKVAKIEAIAFVEND